MLISRYSVTDFATQEDHKKYFKILSEGKERRLQHLQNYLSYRRIGMRGHYVDNERSVVGVALNTPSSQIGIYGGLMLREPLALDIRQ